MGIVSWILLAASSDELNVPGFAPQDIKQTISVVAEYLRSVLAIFKANRQGIVKQSSKGAEDC